MDRLEIADPPLTRRELRRREEAARAPQEAQEAQIEQLPPMGPPQPAAEDTKPHSSPSGRVPHWAIEEGAGIAPQDTVWRAPEQHLYDWQQPASASQPAGYAPPLTYVPPSVRHPSPVKRLFHALGRAISDFFRGVWTLAKVVVLTAVLGAAIWNALTYLVPGFTDNTGRLLAAQGISHPAVNPYSPDYAGVKPPGTGSADGTAPPPGVEASDHRLGSPAPITGSSDSYAFMRAGTDQPFISYDPCRPIHYVVRPQNAPAGGETMIAEAVAAVSRATGFVFINDGLTAEAPSTERPAYQPDQYGNRWAPILFAWEKQSEQPKFTDSLAPGSSTTLGLGGSMSITVDGQHATYVTGQVRLNSAALGTMSRRPGGHETVTSVVMHELAHVVGLDHIGDPTQLMAATVSEQVHGFAAGDLTGLAMLGTGKCRPAV